MLALLLLAACSGSADKSSGSNDTSSTDGCADPVITVSSPQDEAEVAVGERVEFSATVEASGEEVLQVLWAVDGDVEVIGLSGGWTPSSAGNYQITVQAEDDCGSAQVVLDVRVREADTGDTGGDTGGDTASGPA